LKETRERTRTTREREKLRELGTRGSGKSAGKKTTIKDSEEQGGGW
jgi:hypothetical protein